MSKASSLAVLHICDLPVRSANANAVRDSIESFCEYSKHEFFVHSERPCLARGLDLDRFDVIMIHYSICAIGDGYADLSVKRAIAEFKGLKIQFIQDEYRRVDLMVDQMVELGIDLLFTCVPEEQIGKVYSLLRLPNLETVTCLTGYVPENLLSRERPPIAGRKIDVSYRARKPGFWLGELAVEKWKIADDFCQRAAGSGLAMDISYEERDRIYGEDWIAFLQDSKATLGVESGASVIDFTGEIQQRVELYERTSPNPSFEEARELFFRNKDGEVPLNVISPRCFEAACLGTAMVLFEGDYSGILKPWRHYIPLKKDYSNFEEVSSVLKDDARLQEIADRAYEEIAASGKFTYRSFVRTFDEAVDRAFAKKGLKAVEDRYPRFEYGKEMFLHRVRTVAREYSCFLGELLRIPAFWRNRGILIFGAGAGGANAFKSLRYHGKVLAFCDNDAGKWGTRKCGVPVIAPAQIGTVPFDSIWVASLFSGEIVRQLGELGVESDRIKVAGDEMIARRKLPYPKTVAGVVIALLATFLAGWVAL